jgi:hypothetical protein
MQRPQFVECDSCFGTQIQQLLSILAEYFARCGERAITRCTVKQHLAQVGLEFSDNLTDRGLRAVKTGSGAGKATFFSDSKEGFELV